MNMSNTKITIYIDPSDMSVAWRSTDLDGDDVCHDSGAIDSLYMAPTIYGAEVSVELQTHNDEAIRLAVVAYGAGDMGECSWQVNCAREAARPVAAELSVVEQVAAALGV